MGEAYAPGLSTLSNPSVFMRVYYESRLAGHLIALGTANPPNQRVQAHEAGEDDPNSARVEIVSAKEVKANRGRLDPAMLADRETQAELRQRVPELTEDINGVKVNAIDFDWDGNKFDLTFIIDDATRQLLTRIKNKTWQALNGINPSSEDLLWDSDVPPTRAVTIQRRPGSDAKETIIRGWRSAQFLRSTLSQRAVIRSADFPEPSDHTLYTPEPPSIVPLGAGRLALVRALPPQ